MSLFAAHEEATEFAYPEHDGGRSDNDDPVGEFEGGHCKEFSTYAYDSYLTKQDEGCDGEEAGAIFEVECRAACGECAGVKHIPELQEDEDGEEE